jgi:glycosyltransferase involved in cell wall biosynthesis
MTSKSDYSRNHSPIIRKGLVTTIIPVYNRSKLVKEAVASVLAQTYQSLQIILIDDGSTDSTALVVRKLAKRNAVIEAYRQENKGPGAARQLGLKYAKGEYIQFLDSDDLVLPAKFTQQVAALKSDRDAVAAYGKTELIELGGERVNQAWKRTGEQISTMFPLFLNERWWGTSTPLYRRVELIKIGPILNLINEEDWEFDCRLAARGGRLVYVDDFVSIQRRHGEHLSDDGGSDKSKLADRCAARQAIYQSAVKSRVPIPPAEMQTFSKASFLLARECAAVGMSRQVHDLLRLSIKANQGPTQAHKLFVRIGNILGWRTAAFSARLWQRLRVS